MPSARANSPTGSIVQQRPLLVFGPEADRGGAWDAGVAVVEKIGAPVCGGPLPDRVSFPEDHPLYRGALPMTIAGVNEVPQGADHRRSDIGGSGAGR